MSFSVLRTIDVGITLENCDGEGVAVRVGVERVGMTMVGTALSGVVREG